MAIKYGLIAEDASDIEVIKKLAKKVCGKNISSSHFVGKGCGPIKRKAVAWCKAFATKGCSQILLVHDRDRNDADELRSQLTAVLALAPQAKKVVVVPSEELEAWLLSDHSAIKIALNLKKAIKEEHHPEEIASPKEYLGAAVWKVSEKKVTYVNAIHNPLIADHIDVLRISRKCPSFRPFEDFFGA
jgi:Domain of unknown function (DUF4276)